MAIIKKFTSYQNLSNYNVLVDDINPNSDYFRITEFRETFTGGKNAFLIEGSPFLKETTEIKIEILDVDGNPVYYEPGDGIPEYYEGLSKVVAVHIYPDTPIGLGKITILGELKQYVDELGIIRDVSDEWKGAYNVKWEKNFQINRNLQNESAVRFYKRPQVQITEIVKPIFNKTIPTKTVSGSVSGEPIQPGTGTNISTWRAGTLYRLTLSSGSWDKDIDENPINISVNGNSFNPTIIEVLNDRQVLVDTPYSENSLVEPFTSQSFTSSFLDFENEIPGESSLTGSFAKIDLTQLKTFAGDVARVKIYRRSRNEVGDFQFVQESRLESTELLRDITVSSSVEIPYGNFSNDVLTTYWNISSIDHPITVDSSVLSQAVKVDYNGSGVQRLTTSHPFNISKDVEYELSFKTLLSGSTTSDKYLRAYLTGSFLNSNNPPQTSQFEQNFVFVSGSGVFATRQNVSQNILAERDITASLAFEFKGDDWYLSQVSLKNAQETSFSPDEFTLVQPIPRKLEKETFDFRFEFYDINNNYIPVDVNATKEFDGGNDYVVGGTSARILTFESDRNAFRYASGSASPNSQTILLQVTKTNLTGSILYESSAFDQGGNFLTASGWEQYPGLLTLRTDSQSGGSSTLTVANFSGSWTGSGNQPEVYSIVYTASVEDLQEFETVFRVEDGDNAPQLLVTSNANQFIYEPTTLSPKPSGQSITIRAQRKNLESLNSTITVTSGSNLPALIEVPGGDTGGVKTYSISALEFSSSFAQNDFDEVTYNFSSNDVFGVAQTDQITISKVINFDGISLVLSNESTTFPAKSTGEVIGGFDVSSGSVQMFIGGNQIQHIDGLLGQKNAFDIISASGQNVIPTDSTPNTSNYSISSMTADSGSLTLDIRYIAGDSSTSQSFQKVVSYTKAKKAQPSITFTATPQAQTIDANSNGDLLGSITDVVISGFEGNTALTYNPNSLLSGQYKITDVTETNITVASTSPSTSTIDITSLTADSTTETVSISYVDSEGTSGTSTIKFSLSKAKKAAPTVSAFLLPQSQTIDSGSSISDITVSVREGSNELTAVSSLSGNSQYILSVDSPYSFSTSTQKITRSGNPIEAESYDATISYKDSEGTPGSLVVPFSVGVAKQGLDGTSGLGAVSIELNPPSQEVVIDIQDNITEPDDFVVQVYDSLGTYTYDDGLTTDATFKVGTVTSGSNSNGTITPDSVPDANGLVVSVPIQYRDRDSNESAEIIKTHTIRVVAEGSTGPGIVFTGPWDTDRIYQYDISNGRRDAVLYNDVYYATLQQAGTSVGTPDTEPNYWENLGTDSFFVAAEIAIFKESYVQNTLNIGTTSNTISAANITLWGADDYPYFSLGQSATVGTQEYGANGIFIGRHTTAKNNDATNGAYVLSLVNGTTSWMKWNGSSLDIKGSISFTNSPNISTFTNDSGFTDDTAANNAQTTANNAATAASNAATAASNAQTTANSRPKVFRQDSAPSTSEPGGSIWYDTNDDNKLYILVGTTWTATRDGQISQAISDALDAQTTANGVSDDLQDVIDGVSLAGGATFIDGKTIFAPLIAGTDGYISNIFKVGNGGITLDGPNQKIYTGTGTWSNSNTPFYVDNSSNFSLGDKLTWNGSTLNIAGSVNIGGTSADTVVSGASDGANALQPSEAAADVNSNTTNINGGKIRTGNIQSTGYIGTVTNGSTFSTRGMNINLDNGSITSPNFRIDSDGNAEFAGNLAAGTVMTDGSISGGTITGTNFIGATGTFSGTVTAELGNIGGFGIASSEIFSPSSGTKVLSLTAGSTPSLQMLNSGATRVDINSGTVLTALGAGGGSVSPTSVTNYTQAQVLANPFNSTWSNVYRTNITESLFQTTSYSTITVPSTGNYTVSATVATAAVNRFATMTWSGGNDPSALASSMRFNCSVGFIITTNTLNPQNFILDYVFYPLSDIRSNVPRSTPTNLLTNMSNTISKNITLNSGTNYYVYPMIFNITTQIFLPYSAAPYALTTTFYTPAYSGLGADITIEKTEINAGGLQVVKSNQNYVKMNRAVSGTGTGVVMLEVGGSITATGNITANASDIRLKENIQLIENPLDKINKLNGIYFNWNELANNLAGYDTNIKNVGLIAQEVEEVLPEATTIAPADNGDGNEYKTIWYERLVPLLIEGVKELTKKVNYLESENKKLKDGDK